MVSQGAHVILVGHELASLVKKQNKGQSIIMKTRFEDSVEFKKSNLYNDPE